MFKYNIIAVGADPEVFLKDTKGKFISSEGKIGGSKQKPLQMEGLTPGFNVQEDNVAAEYNIPPATSAVEFDSNIFRGLKYIQKVAKKQGLVVAIESAAHFDFEQLNTLHAQTLGCEPDWNVWTRDTNPTPTPPATLRTAAGHIHVSWKNPDVEHQFALGKALDLFLGIPSLLVTKKNPRRELYGKAGAVRFKPYGLEYRTLDNFWIGEKPYRQHVFNMVYYTADRLNKEHEFLVNALDDYSDEITSSINNHNVDQALSLIDKFGVPTFG